MKIAIISPFLTDSGGAEKVTGFHYKELSKHHEVTVITSAYDPKVYPELFENAKIIQLMPLLKGKPLFKTIVNLLLCFVKGPMLKGYDLVIAETPNSHILASKANNYGIPIIWYSHHPNKVAYGYENKNLIITLLNKMTIKFDRSAVKKINLIFANSNFMKSVFNEIYPENIRRKIRVLYPPTDLRGYSYSKSKGYFLCVSRLEKVKRIGLLIEVFNETGNNLFIVGSGAEEAELKRAAKPNIKFLGRVSEAELKKLYSECEAAIQLNTREDFGLVPVEAGASGKPIIAVAEGGFLETVTRKAGVLIKEPYKDNLIKVINNWREFKFKPADCKDNAKRFSLENHMKSLKKVIKFFEANKRNINAINKYCSN